MTGKYFLIVKSSPQGGYQIMDGRHGKHSLKIHRAKAVRVANE